MAELIAPDEIMFKAFQPKVSNRFILTIDGIPSFICKSISRPNINIEAKKMDHINTYRKIQGKAEWQDVTVSLYDPIVPSGAQAVMEWVRLGYESVTGRAGYSDFYKKEVTFNVLGPVGDKVEEWTLKGAFITAANFGELNWETDDPINIELTLAYDYAILQY
tara:strand:+ start:2046 stop:2534 length:489 start_codon:yes stop_codon:yes gene_type:complete